MTPRNTRRTIGTADFVKLTGPTLVEVFIVAHFGDPMLMNSAPPKPSLKQPPSRTSNK